MTKMKLGPARASTRADYRRKEAEATGIIERMSPAEAREALLQVCQDFPEEVLESLEYEGPRL